MQTLEVFSTGLHPLEKFYLSLMTHDQFPVVLEVECDVVTKSSSPRSFVIVQ
jgi:hypothetical protein